MIHGRTVVEYNNTMTQQIIEAGIVHEVPPDLRDALTASPEALAAWQKISSLARNEWICWITSIKKPETRANHIARARAELKAGKRRPCCWAGCFHREGTAAAKFHAEKMKK